MSAPLIAALVTTAMSIAMIIGAALLVRRFYVAVPPGRALVVHKASGAFVNRTGALVLPAVQAHLLVDLTAKTISVERGPNHPLVFKDNKSVELEAVFTIEAGKSDDDVLRIARRFGVSPIPMDALRALFVPKFEEALVIAAKQMNASDMDGEGRLELKSAVHRILGADLDGFVLIDISIPGARLL